MFKKGEKITLARPYNYREICEGFPYNETVPTGTVCEYLGERVKEGFIPDHKLKQKYVVDNWDVLNNEGLKIPTGHILCIPLVECNSSTIITVKDEFLNHYFLEVEAIKE